MFNVRHLENFVILVYLTFKLKCNTLLSGNQVIHVSYILVTVARSASLLLTKNLLTTPLLLRFVGILQWSLGPEYLTLYSDSCMFGDGFYIRMITITGARSHNQPHSVSILYSPFVTY